MTRAPANLLAVRQLLLAHLNVDGDATRSADLEPAEVGIVGNPAHRGGYHCGSDRVDSDDYSVDESPRDRAGLTLDAAALDIGWFEVRVGGVTHNLYTFNRWVVAQLEANTPDSRDIREWIYTLDGQTVRRWDRLRKRSSGDSSHLWHSHGSWFRDAIKAGRDQRPLFRRYLTTIGLIEGDDMTPQEMLAAKLRNPITGKDATVGTFLVSINSEAYRGRLLNEAILAAVKGVDTKAVLARINEVATADATRDAELAELVRAGQSGELTAEQVLAKLRDLLPAGGTPQN